MIPLKEGPGAPFVLSTMTAPLQKGWFRIETDASGAILSCVEQDTKGRKGAHVRYYEAVDAADACAQAKAWYEHRRVQNAEYRAANKAAIAAKKRERVARLKAAHMCVLCGNAKAVTNIACRKCADRQAAHNRVFRAGLPKLPRNKKFHATPEAARAACDASVRRGSEKVRARYGSHQARSYVQLLRRFDETSPRDFRAWLVGKITQLGGAKALAEYESSRAESLDKQSTAAHKRAAKHLRSA